MIVSSIERHPSKLSSLLYSFLCLIERNMTDYFFKIPINRQLTPAITQSILPYDSFSAIPTNPIVVVASSTRGPTRAKPEFTSSAFSTVASLSITIAAIISILPDIILSEAIVRTILFIFSTPPVKRIAFLNLAELLCGAIL